MKDGATKVQAKISKFGSASTLPPQVRECLTAKLAKFVAKYIRPCSAVTGDGFQIGNVFNTMIINDQDFCTISMMMFVTPVQ